MSAKEEGVGLVRYQPGRDANGDVARIESKGDACRGPFGGRHRPPRRIYPVWDHPDRPLAHQAQTLDEAAHVLRDRDRQPRRPSGDRRHAPIRLSLVEAVSAVERRDAGNPEKPGGQLSMNVAMNQMTVDEVGSKRLDLARQSSHEER